MAREMSMVRKLLQGTDLTVNERPSYIRISGPASTVAYGFYRSDGSLRLQIRRPDGQYPDKLIVEGDPDMPMARERLTNAERELAAVTSASVR